MVTWIIIIAFAALVSFFLPIIFIPILFSSIGALKREVKQLKERLASLEGQLTNQGVSISTKKQEMTVSDSTRAASSHIPSKVAKASPVPKVSTKKIFKPLPDNFEKNIATKLPVWIGAVSLIFAAFFLVKYSIEIGWMKPIVRVSIGAVFCLTLLAAGQWVAKKEQIANFKRISQGLVGAGLAGLYVSVYASIHLYGFFSPFAGFVAMAAITAAAVILSLKHGQPIAVFGLIGGLITPALVGSDSPNSIAMFAYLFVLFTGMMVVLVRKSWWKLAITLVLGVFSWSVFWFLEVFSNSDATILVLFAAGVTAVVFGVTARKIASDDIREENKKSVHTLNFAALTGAILTIISVSSQVEIGVFEWSILGLFSMALMTLTYIQPAIYNKALWAKLVITLGLYILWSDKASITDELFVLCGLGTIYIGGSAYLMRRVINPSFWAAFQAISVMSLYSAAYFTINDFKVFQGEDFFWGILALLLSAAAAYQAADLRRKYLADTKIQDYLVSVYALLASGLLSLGLCIVLPWIYIPLAFALQILATSLIYSKNNIKVFENIVIILTFALGAMHYEQFMLFSQMFEKSFYGEVPRAFQVQNLVLSEPILKLGLPAICLILAFSIFCREKNGNSYLNNVLLGGSVLLISASFYYVFRGAFYGTYQDMFESSASFFQRSVLTFGAAISGLALFEFMKRYNYEYLKPWAVALLLGATFRYVFFDLLIHNPLFNSDQKVGSLPLLNAVTLTYGGAAACFMYAAYRKITEENGIPLFFAGVSLFLFSSFTVRQYFHGTQLMGGGVSPAELYSYSAIWLLTGIALVSIGIYKDIKMARMASIGFILLAVSKVFLYDAAELEGLFRIISFLGLGLSLIGLSYFYSKFVFKDEQTD